MNRPAPIHTGFVMGRPLRFYASPLEGGIPDGPWVDLPALIGLLPVPADFAAYYADLFARDWPQVVQRLPVKGGREALLVPWYVAKFPVMALMGQLEAQHSIEHPAADKLWAVICEAAGRAAGVLEAADPESYPMGASEASRSIWADLMLSGMPYRGAPH